MQKTEEADAEPLVGFFEPDEEFTAALRLDLAHPSFLDRPEQTKNEAWAELRNLNETLSQSVQEGMGDVLIAVRDLRAAGRNRFMSKEEREGFKESGVIPDGCYPDGLPQQFQTLLSRAMQRAGLSEYIYASVAKRLAQSEFSGGKQGKLAKLLRGQIAYPTVRNIGLMIRNRNWTLTSESVTRDVKDEQGRMVSRTYVNPVIEITSFKPGAGRVRLTCRGLHGATGKASYMAKKDLLDKLMRLCQEDDGGLSAKGWKKGTLTLRRVKKPGQSEEWQIILSYQSPLVTSLAPGGVLAVHRGMANVLTAAYVNDQEVNFGHKFQGDFLINAKRQFSARRSRLLREGFAGGTRAAGHANYGALKRLGDAEKRFVDTAIWEVAKFVRDVAEKGGVSTVIIEDFSNFLSDFTDDKKRYLQPYLRRWPFFAMCERIKDAVTRRLGLPIQVVSAEYISKKCPQCGHIADGNVVRLPKINVPAPKSTGGPRTTPEGFSTTQDGKFKCEKCEFSLGLDEVACANMLIKHGGEFGRVKEWLGEHMERKSKIIKKMKDSMADQCGGQTAR